MVFDFMKAFAKKSRKIKNKNELYSYFMRFEKKEGFVGREPTEAYEAFCKYLEGKRIEPITNSLFFKYVRGACGLHTKRVRTPSGLRWVYTRDFGVGR